MTILANNKMISYFFKITYGNQTVGCLDYNREYDEWLFYLENTNIKFFHYESEKTYKSKKMPEFVRNRLPKRIYGKLVGEELAKALRNNPRCITDPFSIDFIKW